MCTQATPAPASGNPAARAQTLIQQAGRTHAHLTRDQIHQMAVAPEPVRAALDILIQAGALESPVSAEAIAARLLATWLWAFGKFVDSDSIR